MSATPESKIKKVVIALLKQHDVYYFLPATGGYGRSGVPDIVCCVPGGRFLAIECKAGAAVPTLLQEREMDKIRSRGGIALVIRGSNLAELEAVLKGVRHA